MTVAGKIPTPKPAGTVAGREEWVQAVNDLIADMTEWSHTQGWRTATRDTEVVDESTRLEYTMPILDILTEREYAGLSREVKLVAEPVTFRSATGIGRVDFYIWPAMYRVRLLSDAYDNQWRVKTDSGIYWPMPWNKETFEYIASGLLAT